MNKGIVVEKCRRYLIVLTNEGEFHKAKPNKHAEIGELIEYERIHINRRWNMKDIFRLYSLPNQLISLSFALLLVFWIGYMVIFDENKSYAYISIDMNPSIELLIDHELYVHSLEPLNEDGIYVKNLLGFSYEGNKLDEVIGRLMDVCVENNFVNEMKDILIGVSYEQDEVFKNNPVEKHLNKLLKRSYSDWNMAYIEIPERVRLLAKEKGKPVMALIAKELNQNEPTLFDQNYAETHFSQDMKAMIDTFYFPVRESTDEFQAEIAAIKAEAKEQQENSDEISTDKIVKVVEKDNLATNENYMEENPAIIPVESSETVKKLIPQNPINSEEKQQEKVVKQVKVPNKNRQSEKEYDKKDTSNRSPIDFQKESKQHNRKSKDSDQVKYQKNTKIQIPQIYKSLNRNTERNVFGNKTQNKNWNH